MWLSYKLANWKLSKKQGWEDSFFYSLFKQIILLLALLQAPTNDILFGSKITELRGIFAVLDALIFIKLVKDIAIDQKKIPEKIYS